MSDGVGVAEVSEAVHVSPGHLRRLFHSELGGSPISVLGARRLRRAAGLITSANETLSEIAAACGYSSLSVFSRAFRSEYGMAPGEWKRASIRHNPGDRLST